MAGVFLSILLFCDITVPFRSTSQQKKAESFQLINRLIRVRQFVQLPELSIARSEGATKVSSAKASKQLNQVFLEAVDEALSVLGDEPVKRAFYYQLQKRSNIKRDEIPDKTGQFHEALEGLFYEGASILEKRICKNLYQRFGLEFSSSDGQTLTGCLADVRSKILVTLSTIKHRGSSFMPIFYAWCLCRHTVTIS